MPALGLVAVEQALPGARPGASQDLGAGVPDGKSPAFCRPLADWIDRFLHHLAQHERKSPNTVRHYAHDLELFSRYLRAFAPYVAAPADVEPHMIRGFLRYLSIERGNGPASNRRRLASLRRFFAYLFETGALQENPCSSIPLERAPSRHAAALTRDEARRLLEAAKMSRFPARDHAMFRLFLSCGCTLSELLSLKLDDFDRSHGTITLTGRGGKSRTLTLSPACLSALEEYLQSRPKAPAAKSLFINRRGEPVTKGAVYYAFRQALRRSGLERPGLTVHSLRRTCLILLWEAGVSLRTLQHVAGHHSLATTREYTRSKERGPDPQAWRRNHPLDS